MSSLKPSTVLALEQLGLLKRWHYVSGGGVYIELVEGLNIRELVNLREPAGGLSMDLKDYFIAGLQVLPREEMGEEGVKLYRRLKGLEAILEYRGLLRNKPVFVSRPALRRVSPSIMVDDALANELNSDAELMRLIKWLKPSSFRVLLKSVSEYLARENRGLLEMEREYFEEPAEVTWVLVVSVILPRGLGFKKRVKGVIEMLDRAARHVLEVTSRVRMEVA